MSKKTAKPAKKKATPSTKAKSVKETKAPAADTKGFQIIDVAPIPATRAVKGETRYPIAAINEGAALFVPIDLKPEDFALLSEFEQAKREELYALSSRLSGAVRRFKKHDNEGRKFTVRIIREGVKLGFASDLGVAVRREEV